MEPASRATPTHVGLPSAHVAYGSLRDLRQLTTASTASDEVNVVASSGAVAPAASALVAAFGVAAGARRARRQRQRAAVGPPIAVALRASLAETATLEAGARLIAEAVQASQNRSNVTEFQFQSQTKNRQSYVSQQSSLTGDEDPNAVDEEGLPLVYSVERIASYWDTKPGELSDRWARFLSISTPFITKFFFSLIRSQLWEDEAELAKQAVDNLTELGPTFVKLGQVLSIRPDILPKVTMEQLSRLQAEVRSFSSEVARKTVEEELGRPIDELFSFFSEEPVAAASLAQVYRATLRSSGQEVAVKVQRPGGLNTVSKDLYVLRKLADVTQPLIRRFSSDETDYIALTETFAEGLYTELDFRNEALNAIRMEELMKENVSADIWDQIVIPTPLLEHTTRKVMLSEWVDAVKLSSLPKEEISEFINLGQEVFLTQLLEIGFFHGDPHPGNLLKVIGGPHKGKLCLLDFGLVAQIPPSDREIIVSGVVHLGTQNWDGFIDDFIKLGFLSADTDKGTLVPILQRVLGPYLRGGGASAYKDANFQALTQDLLKINTEVKFSIPPYVSLLARAVATLEGIALQGDPNYQLVAQAYPFVVRKLLRSQNRMSFAALRELLYDSKTQRLRPQRLSTMLQASLGVIAGSEQRQGFIDFDTAPEDGAPLVDIFRFLLSKQASNLRPLLNAELSYGVDLALRRAGRRLREAVQQVLQPRIPILGWRLPALPPPPLLVPGVGDDSSFPLPRLMSVDSVLEAVLPPLSVSDDVDLDTFTEAVQSTIFGNAVAPGELPLPSPQALLAALSALGGARNNEGSAEVVAALREMLVGAETRKVLSDEVLGAVAQELLRTWRSRLDAANL